MPTNRLRKLGGLSGTWFHMFWCGCSAAKDGAKIVIAAKTAEPHPKLPGTIYTAAEDIEKAGGKALPLIVDVRGDLLRDLRHLWPGFLKILESFY
jgi:hypothetical protein